MRGWRWKFSPRLAAWLTVGICLLVLTLAWLGFLASREWERSSALLAQRRADEGAAMLRTALTRDMRAVETTVLTAQAWTDFTFDLHHDTTTLVASAFARYPYPEAFFAWEAGAPADRVLFFTRTNRPPAWVAAAPEPYRYPVRSVIAPPVAEALLERITADAREGRTLSALDLSFGGAHYQVVARLRYHDSLRRQLTGVSGFLVDLQWVRDHYFPELTKQMARISAGDEGLTLALLDEDGRQVVRTRAVTSGGLMSRSAFPVLFFDARSLEVSVPANFQRRSWTVEAGAVIDPAVGAVIRGASWTLVIAPIAVVALVLGLALSARALRASADLAEMRTDFMSSVTHDLKTPIAAILALGETLQRGRMSAATASGEYGSLIVQEGKRLSRLVDNLLAHARISDVADVYSFDALDVGPLVRNAVAGFKLQMELAGFEARMDLAPDLPPIYADRAAMELVLNNLIDNAMRYSGSSRTVRISADARENMVAIHVVDQGDGIPTEEISRVTQRFVRGRHSAGGGSGLGLAIVTRVVSDHHGTVRIESVVGQGTAVTVTIPTACHKEDAGELHAYRRVQVALEE